MCESYSAGIASVIKSVSCDGWRLHWSCAAGLDVRISCLGLVDSEPSLETCAAGCYRDGEPLVRVVIH